MSQESERFTQLICTECGKSNHNGLYLSTRFPTLRICWQCIKNAQQVLYDTCGFIPPLDFLVIDGTWRIEANVHAGIPTNGLPEWTPSST